MRYIEGHEGVGHHLALYFRVMVIVWNAGVVSIAMVFGENVLKRDFSPGGRVSSFLRDCRWKFLDPRKS